MQDFFSIVDEIEAHQDITLEQLRLLLETDREDLIGYLSERARFVARRIFGNEVYIRGLIEFTNFCKNDCYYCGIRCSNRNVSRYRLLEEEILECCKEGYALGFRTFVLQGGEDPYYTDDRICSILHSIRTTYPDCAITLSIGEKDRESYQKYFDAGANRYLLRHETADKTHYEMLHPKQMSQQRRFECLRALKDIGYQVGCGFMVGSPGQTIETLYQDLRLIKEIKPQMVGIGPFIPQKDTPFGQQQPGTLDMTLRLLAILRLLEPCVLLPATTALGTIHSDGRELGILCGANVVMPNLSPENVRKKYALYDHKVSMGEEAAQGRAALEQRLNRIGYVTVVHRGDYPTERCKENR